MDDKLTQMSLEELGDLGNDPAVGFMQLGLAINDRRQNFGPPFPTPDDGCGGIVAARFDAKDREALAHAGSGCAGVDRR